MSYKDLYEKAKNEERVNDLTPTFCEFKKEGDLIVGKFVSASSVSSSLGSGNYNQYLFETDEGLVKFAMGQATDKEVGPTMEPGRVYAVEFKGQVNLGGGRKVNKFKVMEIDTTQVAGSAGEADEAPF